MAGDWIPIHQETPWKREILAISDVMKMPRREVFAIMVEFWLWAQAQSVDGRLVDVRASTLASTVASTTLEFWRAVIGTGWLEEHDWGLFVPNAHDWLSVGAKARLLKANRQSRWRQRAKLASTPASQASTPASTRASTPASHKETESAYTPSTRASTTASPTEQNRREQEEENISPARIDKNRQENDAGKFTWLTPFADLWKATYGGDLPCGEAAKALQKPHASLGPTELLARFTRYCEHTAPKYASISKFSQTLGAYASTPTRPTPHHTNPSSLTIPDRCPHGKIDAWNCDRCFLTSTSPARTPEERAAAKVARAEELKAYHAANAHRPIPVSA